MIIRISYGSLSVLREQVHDNRLYKTLYLLQYSKRGCLASCSFCTQSVVRFRHPDRLSRIIWPTISVYSLLDKKELIRKAFSRICLQTIFKRKFYVEMLKLVRFLKMFSLPLSVATTPVNEGVLRELKRNNVDCLGVGLDAFSKRVFRQNKQPFKWENYIDFIDAAIRVFGKGRVYVHLIVELGEREREILDTLRKMSEKGARIALFPLYDTRREKTVPDIKLYRKVQVLAFLVNNGYNLDDYAAISNGKLVLTNLPENFWKAFVTQGCPGCNRPYYTESPLNPYNFPSIDKVNIREMEIYG